MLFMKYVAQGLSDTFSFLRRCKYSKCKIVLLHLKLPTRSASKSAHQDLLNETRRYMILNFRSHCHNNPLSSMVKGKGLRSAVS